MEAAGVPTAAYQRLDASSNVDAALDAFAGAPWVVKRDVLAGGKGVVVTGNREEAKAFVQKQLHRWFCLAGGFFAGRRGQHAGGDGRDRLPHLPPSQDHKRAYDGDLGPNTGGMGAYCPAPVVSPAVHEKIVQRIVEPMHLHLSSQPVPYRGVLFIGLMIDENEDPFVVEFNVRFGDPECQVTLPLIDTDLFTLLHSAAVDRLEEVPLQLRKNPP